MSRDKNKKKRYTPAYPSYTIKVGYKGVYISQTCFPDGSQKNPCLNSSHLLRKKILFTCNMYYEKFSFTVKVSIYI